MRIRIFIAIMPLFLMTIFKSFGQITVTNEGQLYVNDGQIVYVDGNFVNKSSLFWNRGDLSLTGDFWNEEKVSNPGFGILRFVGGQNQTFFVNDSMSVFDLEINNSSELTLTGDYDVGVFSEMIFTDGIVFTNINSLIAFQPGAEARFYSDFSHINGPAIKIGMDDFEFPIGKGGLLRAAGIENLTESSTFLGEYFNSSYSDLNTDNTLFRVSNDEFWEIERMVGDADANVFLDYESGLGGFADINDVTIAYFDNPWTRINSTYTGGSPNYFISDNLVSEFGFFTFARNQLAQLAVVLELFQSEDCYVELNWIVPPGVSVTNFEIEASTDSINFTKIGEVLGDSVETTGFEIYNFLDYELYEDDKLYYRVKINQPGGGFYYTSIKGLVNECAFKHCAVFPNPVSSKDNLNLRMYSEFEQTLTLHVYDVPGRLLMKQKVNLLPGNNQYPIFTKDLNLPSGMYFLQLSPKKSLKFIVIYD